MSKIPIWTRLWIIGGTLVLVGVGVPLSMMLHLLPSTFLLAGISFVSSSIGIMLGYIAAAVYIKSARDKNHHDGLGM